MTMDDGGVGPRMLGARLPEMHRLDQDVADRNGAEHDNGPVPAGLRIGGDFLTVDRAWPYDRSTTDGEATLTVEGRDQDDRLRAGRVWLHRTDAGWRVRTGQLAPPGEDERLVDLAAVARGNTLLVHRLGKRAVVRRDEDVVKIVRPRRGAAVAEQARRGQDLARVAGFTAPDVMEEGPGMVRFGIQPGESLHDLGSVGDLESWARSWRLWSACWPALARASARTAQLPAHTPHDEAIVLGRWVEVATDFEALPAHLLGALRTRAAATCAELVNSPAQRAVVSHRDLHDKQILAHGDSLGLLDFDTVCMAEPALDLANLWVHAGLRTGQGLWSAEHRDVARAAVLTVAENLDVTRGRFSAYASATALRVTCIYAFRPRYRRLALEWAAGGTGL